MIKIKNELVKVFYIINGKEIELDEKDFKITMINEKKILIDNHPDKDVEEVRIIIPFENPKNKKYKVETKVENQGHIKKTNIEIFKV